MVVAHIFVWMVLVLLSSRITVSDGTVTDIECLKSIRESLVDPFNFLNTTWDFNNKSEGFLCRFTGVECWHPDENRVLNIRLSDLGLEGQFPVGIQKCTSLTGLDLSHNKLSGSIPENISKILPYVTTLDLSFNNFSGGIPHDLAKCSFLNDLKLDNNRLTSNIPLEFGLLDRIKTFTVTNNLLSGPIPTFTLSNISAESFANNLDLCGKPLKLCPGVQRKSHVGVIAAAAAGGITFTSIIVGIFLYYLSRGVTKRKADDPEGNRWAKSMRGTKGIKASYLTHLLLGIMYFGWHKNSIPVSMFEKSVSKMRLSDLLKATNEFSNNNIIGAGRTGPMYKAVFSEGCFLMVKRLQDSQRLEKEFVSEMNTLGNVKHRNLVPLLGFCVAKKERFLVYKFMENGTLYDKLHPEEPEIRNMDWPLRLKIAIGTARAEWIRQLSDDLLLHTVVDKTLPGNGFDYELNQFLKVACKCVVENAKERPTMFEVHQLLGAIGERYHFTTEDDIICPSDTGDTAFPDELIVANEETREVD
ncbi:hypothetical protein SADUNF_Sadunf08G0062900 [Salix dunnii]|uniref:Protein kinase domain-containing protein n=1 Tax=Salix dunnii TaxID=1413687 RepID=A0A835JYR5_9ROSI|nr:hypothetical protein SADUNF_Sadunf08G0062900 [Salix dunnii]